MKLPDLRNFDLKKKRVLVRLDLDTPLRDGQVEDDTRLKEGLPTIDYLRTQAETLVLLGHLGRPEGRVVLELALEPVARRLKELLGKSGEIERVLLGDFVAYKISENIFLLENLRFDKGEEENKREFAERLARLGDFYVNEAFATSHREHASIVGVPKILPHGAGLHFMAEVENLSKVFERPKRPLVFVIGGAKPETKLPMVEKFAKIADCVLVGGDLVKCEEFAVLKSKFRGVIGAKLRRDGLDINRESGRKFVEIIEKAGTVVWNGPVGKYEEEKFATGTRQIARAIARSSAYKVAGGGDTIAFLQKNNLVDRMNWVSTGGGAMLEFLAEGTLPGIEVLR